MKWYKCLRQVYFFIGGFQEKVWTIWSVFPSPQLVFTHVLHSWRLSAGNMLSWLEMPEQGCRDSDVQSAQEMNARCRNDTVEIAVIFKTH